MATEKNYLLEQDLTNIIYGATILGAGGGGSASGGLSLLSSDKKEHGDPKLEMIPANKMKKGAYAAVTAGMGSPKALLDVDFTPYAVNAYNTLVEMAASMGRELAYTIPVEIGGFNTFVPMLIAMMNDIPVIDADGAARAVPALDTLLLHVNGLDTSPLAMADSKNNRLTIELADPRDASEAENIGRNICVAFNMMAGLSGWMVTQEQIQDAIGNGTISYAKSVGACMARYKSEDTTMNLYEYLHTKGNLPSKAICRGKITKVETKTAGGFDYGVAIVAGEDGHEYKVLFQNENLVLFDNGRVVMTAPDIISFYDIDNGMPLTNADTAEGQHVDIGILKVDERWWKRGEAVINDVWAPYFKNVEYDGRIVRFPEN
ncbi:MAG: DUF917 domain-containing protein [Clostridiales bacterium]|nr:DUF917 domain-containing protein [Clostridiales bacterium]